MEVVSSLTREAFKQSSKTAHEGAGARPEKEFLYHGASFPLRSESKSPTLPPPLVTILHLSFSLKGGDASQTFPDLCVPWSFLG